MSLSEKDCIPCHSKTPTFTAEDCAPYLAQLPGWSLNDEIHLTREYEFSDFMQAMNRANKIAEIAESQGHHPDLFISWGKLKIELWTHFSGGITENDFILAAKIEELNK